MQRRMRVSENWILGRISRTLERSWRRCERDIRIGLIECNGVDSTCLLQVMGQCKALVNMATDLLAP
jgi:hypothetical protein